MKHRNYVAGERALEQVLPFRVKPSPCAVLVEEPVSSEEPELGDRLGLPRTCPWERTYIFYNSITLLLGP